MYTETEFALTAMVVLFFFAFLIAVAILTAIPNYFLAKKAGYDKPILAVIPIVGDFIFHDITFGQDKRTPFFVYLATSFVAGFFYATDVTAIIGVLLFVAVALYELYFLYKMYRAFGAEVWLFVLTFVPLVGIFVSWYIAFSSNFQYVGAQSHIIDKYK